MPLVSYLKSLSCLRSSRFSLQVLSPRSFIPLCFKSVIDFELIFVKSMLILVKKFLHVVVQLFQSHFLNRLLLPPQLILPLSGSRFIFMGSTSSSYSVTLIHLSVISSITHCPDHHITLQLRKFLKLGSLSPIILFFNVVLVFQVLDLISCIYIYIYSKGFIMYRGVQAQCSWLLLSS